MKKLVFGVLVVLILALVLANSAFAKDNKISGAYTTNSVGTSEITTFAWDETPYLYSQYNFDNAILETTWTDPSNTSYSFTIQDNNTGDLNSTDRKILNVWSSWDTYKAIGTWSWTAKAQGTSTTLSNTFTVTPEPISYALFLIGGVALAVKQYRKKKDV